jgi:hypothetical protein
VALWRSETRSHSDTREKRENIKGRGTSQQNIIEHPRTSRNILEHPETSTSIKKKKMSHLKLDYSRERITRLGRKELLEREERITFTAKQRGIRIQRLFKLVDYVRRNATENIAAIPETEGELREQLREARTRLAERIAREGEGRNVDQLMKDCTICMEEFDEGERKPVAGRCGHVFCEGCFVRWAYEERGEEARACPTCRTHMERDYIVLHF